MTEDRVSIEIAGDVVGEVPSVDDLAQWVLIALEDVQASVALRVVTEVEMVTLNGQFREKPVPTNVLSFPAFNTDDTALFDGINTTDWADMMPSDDVLDDVLGDIAVCAAVVNEEAIHQGKLSAAHWAHMVIHGVLHLRGHDHQSEDEALEMEQKESALMTSLGFIDPWSPLTRENSGAAICAPQENNHE